PIVYTNAIAGTATLDPAKPGDDLRPLFDTILERVPPPRVDRSAPPQMLVTSLDYDDYRGRIAVGRVFAGTLRPNSPVTHVDREGQRGGQGVPACGSGPVPGGEPGRVGGVRPRRASPGDPHRDDAPGGLRGAGLAAGGDPQGGRRAAVRADGAAVGGCARGVC